MITPINISHIDTLFKLNNDIFIDDIKYQREFIASFCKLSQGFIYYLDDIVVGYILYGMSRQEQETYGPLISVFNIGVLEQYRHKGIGNELLSTVLNLFPKQKISLNVRCENDNAHSLYIKKGFVDIKRVVLYYGNGDSYFMIKNPINS